MPKNRVLLVENGLHENETLKVTLESRGFKVHSIVLTPQGILEAQNQEPDIIILDSSNQTTNFFEIIHTMRNFSLAPILVLSTLDQPNFIAKTLDSGADDVLTKPVSAEVLMASIRKLTRRSRSNVTHEIPPS